MNKIIIEMFKDWVDGQQKMDGKKINPRDFDCWLGGFVAGYTIGSDEWSEEEIKKMINSLVNSKIAKKVGVTGTLEESINIKIYD